jgi:UDP-N-acetylmuramate dehydrogenase
VEGQYKISAAWLIEKAGWKGKRIGDAAVSDKHALVLVNMDKASGDDIIELSKQIQKDINQQFNILLEPEVIMI